MMMIDVEAEIREQRKLVDYRTVEYSLEQLKQRLNQEPTITWDKKRQSKFIESLLLGIPIQPITAINNDDNLEIIDGKQRVFTVLEFINNKLILQNLEVLKKLNGFNFSDLVPSRKNELLKTNLRVIEISPQSDMSFWR
ncbi:MAG: DUF262 domain-containing protein [Merismopedia sp. SIO2A8]|nr:DUF262 domain-containing protein [Symploca sp. SIO2B6]NET47345.1 DUF262 domain-containing protein [Merismopedia sp. SIO2A8]